MALLAGLWPVGLAVILTYLDRAPPLRHAWAHLAGAVVVEAIATVVVLVSLSTSGATPRQHTARSAGVTLTLGLLALAFAVVVWRWRPRKRTVRRPRPAAGPATGPRAAFLLGLLMWLPSPVYLAALKKISDAGAGVVTTTISSAIALVLLLWILELPIALYLMSPVTAQPRLHAVSGWLSGHGRVLVAAVAAGLGLVLTVEGLSGLLA
jgi:hypothetical protein